MNARKKSAQLMVVAVMVVREEMFQSQEFVGVIRVYIFVGVKLVVVMPE